MIYFTLFLFPSKTHYFNTLHTGSQYRSHVRHHRYHHPDSQTTYRLLPLRLHPLHPLPHAPQSLFRNQPPLSIRPTNPPVQLHNLPQVGRITHQARRRDARLSPRLPAGPVRRARRLHNQRRRDSLLLLQSLRCPLLQLDRRLRNGRS